MHNVHLYRILEKAFRTSKNAFFSSILVVSVGLGTTQVRYAEGWVERYRNYRNTIVTLTQILKSKGTGIRKKIKVLILLSKSYFGNCSMLRFCFSAG